MLRQAALVSDVSSISGMWVSRVAAALQKQVSRDFGPLWEVQATVDAFESLEDVPLGYWPIIVVEDVQNAAGVHLDHNGQPFALVEAGDSWSLTASHECLEMLADPLGNRLIAGQSPDEHQGRVEFLVEVCDPPEDPRFAYTVNSILVSDFYTPNYFDPVAASCTRYDFTGAITEPRQVLAGGYLSWHEPISNHWFQEIYFGSSPTFRDLGVLERDSRSLREVVDSMTPQTKRLAHLPPAAPTLTAAIQRMDEAEQALRARAASWREQIEELKQGSEPIDFATIMES